MTVTCSLAQTSKDENLHIAAHLFDFGIGSNEKFWVDQQPYLLGYDLQCRYDPNWVPILGAHGKRT